MRILTLGGTGILSLAVVSEAIDRGHGVTCITRGNRDYVLPKGAVSINGNVDDIDIIANKLESSYDAVIDFLSLDVEQLRRKISILSNRTDQYMFISSATVYKISDEIVDENSLLGNQYWSYADNKIRSEKYLIEFCKDKKIHYTIIRPYVTYGNTRIPFGIISNGNYWSLANRILCEKPILMWDNGKAVCTITHTKDFACGLIDLVGNERAFDEDFHITSDERMNWSCVLHEIADALGKKPVIFNEESKKIIEMLPEYEGILMGDKARNRLFDNSKIKKVAPNFKDFIPFSEGIKETIRYFANNPNERIIDYYWDGVIDRSIIRISRERKTSIKYYNLGFSTTETQNMIINKVRYYKGKNELLDNSISYIKGVLR